MILDAIEEVRRPRKALVLFTGALLGFDEVLEPLDRLKNSGLTLTGVLTTSAEYVLDKGKIDALGMEKPSSHLIGSHDVLIIPTCTANTVAKAAYGIADNLATNLISEFLSNGKPIVAVTTAADPDSTPKKTFFPLMPPAQALLMRDNLARFRALGVHTCDAAGLVDCVGTVLGSVILPASPSTPASSTSSIIPPDQTVNPDSRPADGVRGANRGQTTVSTPIHAPLETGGARIGVAAESEPRFTPRWETGRNPTGRYPGATTCTTCTTCDHLIAARHIQSLRSGSTLTVPRDAIVTQLADDLARTRSIRIERA